jgi:hypothetical protein
MDNYSADPRRDDCFCTAIRAYCPGLPDGTLQPAYVGVSQRSPGRAAPRRTFRLDREGSQRRRIDQSVRDRMDGTLAGRRDRRSRNKSRGRCELPSPLSFGTSELGNLSLICASSGLLDEPATLP